MTQYPIASHKQADKVQVAWKLAEQLGPRALWSVAQSPIRGKSLKVYLRVNMEPLLFNLIIKYLYNGVSKFADDTKPEGVEGTPGGSAAVQR